MKTIVLDLTKKLDKNKIIYKDIDKEKGFIFVDLDLNGKEYKGKVISISSNGKYTIELLS